MEQTEAQTELIPKRLDGKIAIITAGNSRIGVATAHRLVEDGAYVFIRGIISNIRRTYV